MLLLHVHYISYETAGILLYLLCDAHLACLITDPSITANGAGTPLIGFNCVPNATLDCNRMQRTNKGKFTLNHIFAPIIERST